MQFAVVGNITRIIWDTHARTESRGYSRNVLTSGGLSMIAAYLGVTDPATAPKPPTYLAIGTGLSPVGRYWTTLQGEQLRKDIGTARTPLGWSVTYHTYLAEADYAGKVVGQYGLFGATANAAADTGTLFAVANEASPFTKGATTTVSIDWTITVSGVV